MIISSSESRFSGSSSSLLLNLYLISLPASYVKRKAGLCLKNSSPLCLDRPMDDLNPSYPLLWILLMPLTCLNSCGWLGLKGFSSRVNDRWPLTFEDKAVVADLESPLPSKTDRGWKKWLCLSITGSDGDPILKSENLNLSLILWLSPCS